MNDMPFMSATFTDSTYYPCVARRNFYGKVLIQLGDVEALRAATAKQLARHLMFFEVYPSEPEPSFPVIKGGAA